jgi:hypothetical protein
MTIRAIETAYNGYRFRSRLEARWAVALDTLAVRYEYEKQGFDLGAAGRYLPDFWLPDHDFWVEVKGTQEDAAADWEKIEALADGSRKAVFVAVGSVGEETVSCRFPAAGQELFDGLEEPLPAPDQSAVLKSFQRQSHTTVWGLSVVCPVCGFDYVHPGSPEEKNCDDYSAWDGRGKAVRVPFWCENWHSWTLRFGFHKGNTFLAVENVVRHSHNLPLYLAGWDKDKLQAAYRAARRARFEHGETPPSKNEMNARTKR